MKRRTFIQRATKISVAGVIGSFPYAFVYMLAPNESVTASSRITLPGALENKDEFNQACIGCGVCGEVCPVQCIKFHKHTSGQHVNTPYINPQQKGCILCGKCMEICPTNALTVTAITDIRMGIAQIDRVACYPWVDRAICGACVSVCPLHEKAIKFDFGNIYRPVVQQGCVGCGQCVEICPEPSLPINIVKRSQGTIATHKAA